MSVRVSLISFYTCTLYSRDWYLLVVIGFQFSTLIFPHSMDLVASFFPVLAFRTDIRVCCALIGKTKYNSDCGIVIHKR